MLLKGSRVDLSHFSQQSIHRNISTGTNEALQSYPISTRSVANHVNTDKVNIDNATPRMHTERQQPTSESCLQQPDKMDESENQNTVRNKPRNNELDKTTFKAPARRTITPNRGPVNRPSRSLSRTRASVLSALLNLSSRKNQPNSNQPSENQPTDNNSTERQSSTMTANTDYVRQGADACYGSKKYQHTDPISVGTSKQKTIKIGSLNVCGLRRRAQYPDFVELVNEYDILCFSETKTDETDIITFPGFCLFTQPRKQRYLRKSGGISIYFKEGISKYPKVVETQSDYALWIEIDKCLMKTDENVILGRVYIPPENSNFFNEDEFLVLETEITSFRCNYNYVFIRRFQCPDLST